MTSLPVIASTSLPAPVSTRNAWVPLAQWLAILAMTIEHATKFIWPGSPFTPWAIALGRVAFPLFAGMVAWHLVHNTRRPIRYGLRLLVVGSLAQLPYVLVVTPDKLNVCFTLAAGLAVVWVLDQFTDRLLKLAALIPLGWLAFALGPHVEYHSVGLFLVPVFVLAFRHPDSRLALLPLLTVASLLNGAPLHMVIATATAGVLVLLPNVSGLDRVPALPRGLRLSWYPLHLAVIALVMLVGAL
ncbi:TraX family protein [Salinicola avicenniae]|uniref:TraX family protein n=1 Tax=Salinicola avicenniae TaxID=2916836 RepID=UPI00207460B8|nr:MULTISPECIES: TraX family protein [unclassified Salinicola]